MRKVAVLVSSGIESASMTYLYLSKGYLLYPIYVRCGMEWEEAELAMLRRLWSFYKRTFKGIMPVKIVPLRGLPGPPDTSKEEGLQIPLRNLTLLAVSALITLSKGVDKIAIGSLGLYPFPDNNREYINLVERLMSEGLGKDLTIETPFMGMSKWEVIKGFWGKVPFHLTFSCASPIQKLHCGSCAKCFERKEGFLRAGVPDPTCYLS